MNFISIQMPADALKKILVYCVFISTYLINAQSTDLAISVEVRNMVDAPVSQVQIYEPFYYLVTITNSGNSVNNATFNFQFNTEITINSYESFNALGGAAIATNIGQSGNILTGVLPSMPTSSSVQVKVYVSAPVNSGGISFTANVLPPNGTMDSNPGSNQSIISLNVYGVPLDFSIEQVQVDPAPGNSISTWGDPVKYHITITNNAAFPFPITGLNSRLFITAPTTANNLTAEIVSINCIGTSGMDCSAFPAPNGTPSVLINYNTLMYSSYETVVFPAGASMVLEIVYEFMPNICVSVTTEDSLQITGRFSLKTDNIYYDVVDSNDITTVLLPIPYCPCTDVAIYNTVTSGLTAGVLANWNDFVTITTTLSNNGAENTSAAAYLANIGPNPDNMDWNIVSVSCTSTVGNPDCANITFDTIEDMYWITNPIFLESNASVTFETVVQIIDSGCTLENPSFFYFTSYADDMDIEDCILINNSSQYEFQTPDVSLCYPADLSVTQVQTNPIPPIGTSYTNLMPWEPVTYRITVTNNSTSNNSYFKLRETCGSTGGTLLSANCILTTGLAQYQPLTWVNTGIPINPGTSFFRVTEEDNWLLPAASSITFEAVISWNLPCTDQPTQVYLNAYLEEIEPVYDPNDANNFDNLSTFFVPCADLVVQTYPSVPTTDINSDFNWIVDITNADNGTDVINASFENIVNPAFTINGMPTCMVTSGNAQCIGNFTITGNSVTGTVPFMETGSTIQVVIPVTSPPYGGSFNNISAAQPNPFNNGDAYPNSNVSISSIQIIAPPLTKTFNPETILEGQVSLLTFTLNNIIDNPEQEDISFTDNLPPGITLISVPEWVEANGVTADFLGEYGDTFVGVENLHFPEAVETCSFAVYVTADTAGLYINQFSNFTNIYNIQATNIYATLTVNPNPHPDLDLSISKNVNNETPKMGETVTFTITLYNNSSVFATNIEVTEILPQGYILLDYETSYGEYDGFYWSIPILFSGEYATLQITAEVTGIQDYVNRAIISHVLEEEINATNNIAEATVVPDCFRVYNGISPNGDGLNDQLIIDCITYFPKNNLKIYNRLGELIFEQNNYDNTWEGFPNRGLLKNTRQVLPVGTYYYILRIPEMYDEYTGWIYINY